MQGIVSCIYCCVPNINDLVNYTVFNESLFVTFCVAGLLWLRYKEPDMERPIKVRDCEMLVVFLKSSAKYFRRRHCVES